MGWLLDCTTAATDEACHRRRTHRPHRRRNMRRRLSARTYARRARLSRVRSLTSPRFRAGNSKTETSERRRIRLRRRLVGPVLSATEALAAGAETRAGTRGPRDSKADGGFAMQMKGAPCNCLEIGLRGPRSLSPSHLGTALSAGYLIGNGSVPRDARVSLCVGSATPKLNSFVSP